MEITKNIVFGAVSDKYTKSLYDNKWLFIMIITIGMCLFGVGTSGSDEYRDIKEYQYVLPENNSEVVSVYTSDFQDIFYVTLNDKELKVNDDEYIVHKDMGRTAKRTGFEIAQMSGIIILAGFVMWLLATGIKAQVKANNAVRQFSKNNNIEDVEE